MHSVPSSGRKERRLCVLQQKSASNKHMETEGRLDLLVVQTDTLIEWIDAIPHVSGEVLAIGEADATEVTLGEVWSAGVFVVDEVVGSWWCEGSRCR